MSFFPELALPGPAIAYAPPTPANLERERVAQILAPLIVYHRSQREPEKFYAQWAGGSVEINDDLLARYICPSDLLGVPCEWDEILPEGCSMVRLCKTITKYTMHQCPDGTPRDPKEPTHPRKCGHIHHEVDISCRFIATAHRNLIRRCKQVLHKNRMCSAGHDFEIARMRARDAHDVHKEAARAAGSVGQVKFGWTY